MIGRLPEDQAGSWQLISVNINRPCSSAISVTVFLSSSLFRKRDLGMCLNCGYRGMCVMVANWGSPLWWVSDQFFKIEITDPGGSKRDVQPFSLESFLVWPCVLETARKIWMHVRHQSRTAPKTTERGQRRAEYDVSTVMPARMWKRPKRIQEANVVWNYEGFQLQDYFNVVLFRS